MKLEFMGKQIDGIAFDLEGTVVNLEKMHHQAHASVGSRLGLHLDLDNPQTFVDIPHLIGGPDRKIIEEEIERARLLGVLTESNPNVDELLAYDKSEYRRLLSEAKEEDFYPREGFLNYFEQVLNYGIPVAIGSLTKTSDAFYLLAKSGLAKYFRSFNIICAEDVTNLKPDPEVYRATAGLLKISPYKQLVFEDSHNGITAAYNAGSIPVAVPVYDMPDLNKRLTESGAAKIFKNWGEITIDSYIRMG